MQAYFWGTRGSLPVAPDGVAIREKIRRALLKANGRRLRQRGRCGTIHRRRVGVSGAFHLRWQLVLHGNHRRRSLHVLRHGLRPALLRSTGHEKTRDGPAANLQFFYVPCALGPHYGVPVLSARLHSRQYHPHSRRASRRRARRSVSPPAIGSLFSGEMGPLRRDHRICPFGRGALVRHRWSAGQGEIAASSRGFLRLPLRAEQQSFGLFHRRRT